MIGGIIYRLTLHPLAKFSGPFWCKISGWPQYLSSKRGSRHIDLYNTHQKYGDIVRTDPNTLSFRTVEALHDIYVDRKANLIETGFVEANRKINSPGLPRNLYSTSNRQLHDKKRKVMSHAFSERLCARWSISWPTMLESGATSWV